MNLRKLALSRIAVALAVIIAVIVLGALRPGPARVAAAPAPSAIQSCGVRGTYGYTGFGTVFPGNALGLPAGSISTNGTVAVTENGHITIHEVEVVDGQVVSPAGGNTFEGTLTVNPDCTATATLPPLPGTSFVSVIVDNGKQIRALITIPGVQINFLSTMRVHP